MPVPLEIRQVPRPKNTVVIDSKSGGQFRHAVLERRQSVCRPGHNPSPRNGKTIGHIIDGKHIPCTAKTFPEKPEWLAYGAAALTMRVRDNILPDLREAFGGKTADDADAADAAEAIFCRCGPQGSLPRCRGQAHQEKIRGHLSLPPFPERRSLAGGPGQPRARRGARRPMPKNRRHRQERVLPRSCRCLARREDGAEGQGAGCSRGEVLQGAARGSWPVPALTYGSRGHAFGRKGQIPGKRHGRRHGADEKARACLLLTPAAKTQAGQAARGHASFRSRRRKPGQKAPWCMTCKFQRTFTPPAALLPQSGQGRCRQE